MTALLSVLAALLSLVTADGAARAPSYVVRCGTAFCRGGQVWRMNGASVLGALADPAPVLREARAAGLNTVRVVDFLANAPYDEAAWRRVDRVVSVASGLRLAVVLDLSTYRNLLARKGVNPYTTDWQPFLRFVAARYRTNPTIALVSLAGEVEPPNGRPNALRVTGAQVTAFYARTLAQWHALDRRHLVSTGGLLQLDWDSGIDWPAIMALPGNDACAVHLYGDGDRRVAPAVARTCRALGRPFVVEEFGFPGSLGDAARAQGFTATYRLAESVGAAGVAFWNVGPQTGPGTYDVNRSTPLTWRAVSVYAARGATGVRDPRRI